MFQQFLRNGLWKRSYGNLKHSAWDIKNIKKNQRCSVHTTTNATTTSISSTSTEASGIKAKLLMDTLVDVKLN